MSYQIENIWQLPAQSDQAVSYLQNLFGMPISWFYSSNLPALPGGDKTHILSSVLVNLNAIVLTGALFIFAYILVMGVINTAEQGTPFGKEMSALWTAIRSIGSVLSMVPLKFGFGAMQYLLLYCILLGVHLATNVWDLGVKSIYSGATATVPPGLAKKATRIAAIGFLYSSVDKILDGSSKDFSGTISLDNSPESLYKSSTREHLDQALQNMPVIGTPITPPLTSVKSNDDSTFLGDINSAPEASELSGTIHCSNTIPSGQICALKKLTDVFFPSSNSTNFASGSSLFMPSKLAVDSDQSSPPPTASDVQEYWETGFGNFCAKTKVSNLHYYNNHCLYNLDKGTGTANFARQLMSGEGGNGTGQTGVPNIAVTELPTRTDIGTGTKTAGYVLQTSTLHGHPAIPIPFNIPYAPSGVPGPGPGASDTNFPNCTTNEVKNKRCYEIAVDWEVGNYTKWPGHSGTINPGTLPSASQRLSPTDKCTDPTRCANYMDVFSGNVDYDFNMSDGGTPATAVAKPSWIENSLWTPGKGSSAGTGIINKYVGSGCVSSTGCTGGAMKPSGVTYDPKDPTKITGWTEPCTELGQCSLAPEGSYIMNELIQSNPVTPPVKNPDPTKSLAYQCKSGTNPTDIAQNSSGNALTFPFSLSQAIQDPNGTGNMINKVTAGQYDALRKSGNQKLLVPSQGTPIPMPVDLCRSEDNLCVQTNMSACGGHHTEGFHKKDTKPSITAFIGLDTKNKKCFWANTDGMAVRPNGSVIDYPASFCDYQDKNGSYVLNKNFSATKEGKTLTDGDVGCVYPFYTSTGKNDDNTCPDYAGSWWNGGQMYLSLNDQLAKNLDKMSTELSNTSFSPRSAPTVTDPGAIKTFNIGYSMTSNVASDTKTANWAPWSAARVKQVSITVPEGVKKAPLRLIPWDSSATNAQEGDVDYNVSVTSIFNPDTGTMKRITSTSTSYVKCADRPDIGKLCTTLCVSSPKGQPAKDRAACKMGPPTTKTDSSGTRTVVPPAPQYIQSSVLEDPNENPNAGSLSLKGIDSYLLVPDPASIVYNGPNAAKSLQDKNLVKLYNILTNLTDPQLRAPIQLLVSIQNEYLQGIMSKEKLGYYILNMLTVLKVNGLIDGPTNPSAHDDSAITSPVQIWITQLFNKLLGGGNFSANAMNNIKFFSWAFMGTDSLMAADATKNVTGIMSRMYQLGEVDPNQSILSEQYNMIGKAQSLGVDMITAVTDTLADITSHYKQMFTKDLGANGTVGGVGIAAAMGGSLAFGTTAGSTLATITQISLQFMQFFETLAFAQSLMWLPIALGVLGAIFTAAITFAVVLPLTPFLLFWAGQVAWLLGCIEAMAAAPLLAYALLLPGGHGTWGHAIPGFKMLLNVVFRPVMMVVGLFASMVLTYFLITMSANVFHSVTDQIMSKTTSGMAQGIIACIIVFTYATFILMAYTKCFSAIYVIPERVMMWLGGQGDKAGQEELQQMTQAVNTTSQSAVQSGSQTMTQQGQAEQQGTSFGSQLGEASQSSAKIGGAKYDHDKKKAQTATVQKANNPDTGE